MAEQDPLCSLLALCFPAWDQERLQGLQEEAQGNASQTRTLFVENKKIKSEHGNWEPRGELGSLQAVPFSPTLLPLGELICGTKG